MDKAYHNAMSRLFYVLCQEVEFGLRSRSKPGAYNSNRLMTFAYQDVEELKDYYRVREKLFTVDIPVLFHGVDNFKINSVTKCFSLLKNGVLLITFDLDYQSNVLRKSVDHTKDPMSVL